MSNPQRGEIEILLGSRTRTLCLTLGALAELESRLDDEDIISFTDRLVEGNIKARDLIYLLGAALRGGGEAVTDEEVAGLMLEGGFSEAVELAARLIAIAFGGVENEDKKKEMTPQAPVKTQPQNFRGNI